MPPFFDRLASAVQEKNSALVVGIDPHRDLLPSEFQRDTGAPAEEWAEAIERFCIEVLDVVAPHVPAVKPQAAFFEAIGWPGMRALSNVIAAARERELLVILDAKRGDIGSTAKAYAQGLLGNTASTSEHFAGDALTVNPYLGEDSLEPFVTAAKTRSCGLFVLVKTSNRGGALFQDRLSDGEPMYRHVATLVEKLSGETASANGYGVAGGVVGATHPQQLAELRAAMPHVWFLVPGFGAQGGTAEDVRPAFDTQGLGAIINSSRGILFAHRNEKYAHFGEAQWKTAVEAATRDTNDLLNQVRA